MAKLNLPQAQKAAEIYLNKGAAFPETIAKMRMEQVERGEQNAMKLKEIEAQKERDAAAALERDRLTGAGQERHGDACCLTSSAPCFEGWW